METLKTSHLKTIRDCERQLISLFNQSSIMFGHGYPDALSEAWAAISYVLALSIHEREVYLDARLSASEIKKIINIAIKRIRKKKPMAYLTGEAWLCDYHFKVERGTIIPRSLLAESIVNRLTPWLDDDFHCENILELCCGGGSLLVIAAHAFGEAQQVDGVDIDDKALRLARKNIAEYQLESRINLHRGDLFNALTSKSKNKKYDLIISNPPYVKSADMKNLPKEYQAEPKLALDGGENGLELVEKIIAKARKWLTTKGYLLLEIGGNADDFLATFPKLSPIFLNNSSGENCILLLNSKDLPK